VNRISLPDPGMRRLVRRRAILPLYGAGIEPLVLAGKMEAPVLLEVAVADDRAEGEDGFGTAQAPSGPSYIEAVGGDAGMRPR
jgi:hypothetical protein